MGLDQYWLVETYETLHTHRKFNALQGFMEDEWKRLGHEDDINCQRVPVTEKLLQKLENKVDLEELQPTAGFFYGSTEKDKWYLQDLKDLKEVIIPDLRQRLEDGAKIFYSCWY